MVQLEFHAGFPAVFFQQAMKLFSRLGSQTGNGRPDAERFGVALGDSGKGLDFRGDYLEAALALHLKSSRDHDRRVGRQKRFHLGVEAGEYNRLHGSAQVLKLEHGHEFALLRAAGAALGDKTGHLAFGAIAAADKLGQRLGGELCQFLGKTVQRMPGNVIAQRFLLEGQELIERPFRDIRRLGFRKSRLLPARNR